MAPELWFPSSETATTVKVYSVPGHKPDTSAQFCERVWMLEDLLLEHLSSNVDMLPRYFHTSLAKSVPMDSTEISYGAGTSVWNRKNSNQQTLPAAVFLSVRDLLIVLL